MICAVALVAMLPASLLAWAALVAVFCVFSARVVKNVVGRQLLWAVALGLCFGLWEAWQQVSTRLSSDCELRSFSVVGRVASLPRRTALRAGVPRQRFEFQLTEPLPGACAGPRRLLLSYYGEQVIDPTGEYRLNVVLKRPWGLANPGSFNMQSWYAQSGIHAVGRVAGPVQPLVSSPSRVQVARVRLRVSQAIESLSLSPPSVAFLQAITVADRSGLNSTLWQALQVFGLNHLAVISGLHVSLVAGLGWLLGAAAVRLLPSCTGPGLSRYLPALIAWALAFGYAALAGFGLAASRALLMLTVFVAAQLLARAPLGWNHLLLAAVVQLLVNPLAVLGSGAWLSYGAVASLLWLAQWKPASRRIFTGWKVLGVHGYMALVMLALGAWWFGGASVISAVANTLLAPVVTLFVVPLTLLAAVCSNWAPGIAQTLWHLAAWPLEYALPWLMQWAQTPSPWLFYRFAPALGEVVLACVGVALIVLPAGLWLRCGALLLLVPCLLPAAPAQGPGALVHFLDVGQGLAVVVEHADYTLVYDVGGGDPAGVTVAQSVVLPFLRSRGRVHINDLVISHGDLDHSAGLGAVQAQINVERLWHAPAMFVPRGRACEAGKAWRRPEGPALQFFAPAPGERSSRNNGSCVLGLEVNGIRLILPGDIDTARERQVVSFWRDALSSQVLSAAHHGSNSSSGSAWLNRVQPEVVVINSGYRNRFGHPHVQVMARLNGRGITVFNTALSGAVTMAISPAGQVEFAATRAFWRPYWM